ncbi:hypothetical protein [Sphingobacterium arenae]|uniref:DUF3991 domain-containing protein n=1 Tax=Sphingobacterium arenae TaxID=1280598 RepID=A0ABR7XYC1_9SPHI|nr:hypothetical protein [Sphingobacterium arenae]MBD1424054.1 hypothetical protein [Sphingobacterium arenae]
MTSNKNNDHKSSYETLPITSLLRALGHAPVSITDEESFYPNVFGSATNNRIVMEVNHRLNLWFDRSLGGGGNLLDFARAYWPDLSPEEIRSKLQDIHAAVATMTIPKDKPRRKRKAIKIPHYQIDRTNPLGYNTEVTDFLMESGLWELADLNMQEVHYFVTDQKGKRKDFHAAGWRNENGGWEVRAQHFESCIGPKGMTFLSHSPNVLAIFPEYVDYLKTRNDNRLPYASVLILNYPDFLSASTRRARYFEKVLLYADDSREGYEALAQTFRDELPHTTVISIHP